MAVVVRVRRPVKAPQQLERLIGRHFISRIKTNGKKRNLAHLCKVCNEADRNHALKTINHNHKKNGNI
jgi:hypothetical protein